MVDAPGDCWLWGERDFLLYRTRGCFVIRLLVPGDRGASLPAVARHATGGALAPGAPFAQPVDAKPLAGGGWLVAEHGGRVLVAEGAGRHELLDLSGVVADPNLNWEWGLLSVARRGR